MINVVQRDTKWPLGGHRMGQAGAAVPQPGQHWGDFAMPGLHIAVRLLTLTNKKPQCVSADWSKAFWRTTNPFFSTGRMFLNYFLWNSAVKSLSKLHSLVKLGFMTILSLRTHYTSWMLHFRNPLHANNNISFEKIIFQRLFDVKQCPIFFEGPKCYQRREGKSCLWTSQCLLVYPNYYFISIINRNNKLLSPLTALLYTNSGPLLCSLQHKIGKFLGK